MSTAEFLYRAMRPEEIKAGALIPKAQGPFMAGPRIGIDTRVPFVLGPTAEHAVRQHQWNQAGWDTAGVSTTPHFERALFYAARDRTIAVIRRDLLPALGIQEFVVNEWLSRWPDDIACLEDDEVILVGQQDGPFPANIIGRIITLDVAGEDVAG